MNIKIIIAFILPIIPLVEGMFSFPYFSPKYLPTESTIPFIQSLVLVFLLLYGILWKRSLSWEPISGCIALLCISYSILTVTSVNSLFFAALVSLAYVLIFLDHDPKTTVKFVNAFIVSLVIIVVAIWIVRFIAKGGDAMATRSGANIYAANAVESLIMLGYMINIAFNKNRKDWLWLSGLALMGALFFSRTGLIINVILIFSWAAIYAIQRKKQIILFIGFISIFVLVAIIALQSYVENILMRFGFVGDGETLIRIFERQVAVQANMQRGLIWADAIKAIKEYPVFGVGFGEFKHYGGFTSAHNIILNNLAEFGLVFGTFLNATLLAPYMYFRKIIDRRDRLYIAIIFTLFLLKAVIAGQKIMQATGYVSSFYLLFFFALFSVLSSNIKDFRA